MDHQGYVLSLISFLLIIPAVLMMILIIDAGYSLGKEESLIVSSNQVSNTMNDLQENIGTLSNLEVQKVTYQVIETGEPVPNSRELLKERIQEETNNLINKYKDNQDLDINCSIISVDNTSDPFIIELRAIIIVGKDETVCERKITHQISLEEYDPPLPDPLPFIKCKNQGNLKIIDGKIIYDSSLVSYLESRNIENAYFYENATSSALIRKCPYSPYESHGNTYLTLINCLENGFYHESNDGACFLCRLEGKATCSHRGFETFIIPAPTTNYNLLSAPCSIDHVIFDDTVLNGTYSGMALIYREFAGRYYFLFLDNGHRNKYGLPCM